MALSPLGLALMMQPPGAPARPGQVGPTDVLGAYNLATNTAEQQYQAKLAQQNAMWGGLAGLGSAGIVASPKLFGTGGPLSGLFGSTAAPAATTAAAAPGSIGAAATDFAANPILSDADFGSLLSAGTPSLWGGAAGTAADAGAGAGSVANGIAADTALAGGADAAATDAGGTVLASLLPFLFG